MSSLQYIWACCRVEEEEDGTRSRAKILDYEAIGDDMDKFNEELERQESRIKFRVEVGGIEGMEEYVEWSDMCEFSRPELAYAVNCVARYMFCPKRSHELALIRIGKYLKATRNKGLVITPSENVLAIDCSPDADFGGLWSHERPDDPACVKSRTGFMILAANCPIVWKSTLQSKTALSTMEAEITALAHCCKELFPILELAKT